MTDLRRRQYCQILSKWQAWHAGKQ